MGTQNYYYIVSVAGTTNLNGISDWQIGDWAIFNGTVWQKVDNTDAVTSVNGQVGTVVLNAANVGATANTTYVLASGLLTGGGQLNANVTLGLTTVPVANVPGAVPNTVNIIAGTGLSGGGALTGNVTINNAGVLDFNGRTGNVSLSNTDVITALGYTPGTSNTSGTVTSITAGTGLNGGTITTNGTISLANTTVTAGTYGSASGVPQIVVDAQGRITSASNVAIGGASTVVTNVVTILSGSLLSWTNNSVAVITWENNSLQTIGWTSGTYFITNNNATILANCSAEPLSTQLPAAGTVTGQQFIIKKIDSSGNAATVSTTSSETIDGATTYALSAQYRSVTLQSDGASYWITSKVT